MLFSSHALHGGWGILGWTFIIRRPIVNLENYFPVLLFILVGIGVGVAPQVLGRLLGPHRPDVQ